MLGFLVGEAQNLKEFTDNNYAQASFVFRALLKNKEIRVNGKKTDKDVRLYAGDYVEYYLTRKQEEREAYSIVYQDENLLVIDKDSGVNSEAVFAGLKRAYGEEVRFIHRLDRNTKGLLAFARTPKAEEILLGAFKAHTVKKVYHALCFGSFIKQEDILTAYLKKDEKRALVRIFEKPAHDSEKIVTEYKVLAKNAETSKVEITLHTGKTHQIRAHLAHIGCPVVGDMKYGDEQKNKAKGFARQCLVAKYLSLEGVFPYLRGQVFTSKFEAEEK